MCVANSHDLEEVPSPINLSPRLLRSHMNIRPIQVDLDLKPDQINYSSTVSNALWYITFENLINILF